MDIGSNYGALSYLLKKNNEKLKFILIDFPEALSTANYFLKKEYPSSKIATFEDLKNLKKIDKHFVKKTILFYCLVSGYLNWKKIS